ncbi:MAG TPA: sigma-70 family RNA polymerase sigma factor [Burkholderiales bacterium]|nr:sigma-70 family RNA polymerase sigma factor [Burkholderiales bacterium]
MAEMPANSGEITRLLKAWGRGDSAALDRLTPLVYEELRRLARNYMRKEHPGHTLQATALVNEAFVRLVDARQVDWRDRAHFFAVSARMMRRILVDAARIKASLKRGGAAQRVDHSTPVNLDQFPTAASSIASQVCALDDALRTLARMDPRRAQVIELRYFGGLTVEETGHVLKISPQSVMRDWKLARAWLARELDR